MIHSTGAILICDHIWFAGPVIQYMTGQLWWLNEIILINNHKYVKRFIWFIFARERHLQKLQEALNSTKRAKINLRNQNVTLHDISFQHPNDWGWSSVSALEKLLWYTETQLFYHCLVLIQMIAKILSIYMYHIAYLNDYLFLLF